MSESSDSNAQLFAALIKAQGEFEPIEKNREGVGRDMRTFDYADLDELIKKTRPALVANGLGVMQPIRSGPNGQELVTRLIHTSGAIEESVIKLSAEVPDIQTYGATITFLRRYAYQAILCISADDDLDSGSHGGAALPRQGDAQQPADTEPTYYSQLAFEKNLPAWKASVEAGKNTPERIISMVQTKAPLTEEQLATIRALTAPEGAEAK